MPGDFEFQLTNHAIRASDHAWLRVNSGEQVELMQVIASTISPISISQLDCSGVLPSNYIPSLLASRERTQRFTGVKLARLLRDGAHRRLIEDLTSDPEEDIYIRLEGMSYLASVCGQSARDLFGSVLKFNDPQQC